MDSPKDLHTVFFNWRSCHSQGPTFVYFWDLTVHFVDSCCLKNHWSYCQHRTFRFVPFQRKVIIFAMAKLGIGLDDKWPWFSSHKKYPFGMSRQTFAPQPWHCGIVCAKLLQFRAQLALTQNHIYCLQLASWQKKELSFSSQNRYLRHHQFLQRKIVPGNHLQCEKDFQIRGAGLMLSPVIHPIRIQINNTSIRSPFKGRS